MAESREIAFQAVELIKVKYSNVSKGTADLEDVLFEAETDQKEVTCAEPEASKGIFNTDISFS